MRECVCVCARVYVPLRVRVCGSRRAGGGQEEARESWQVQRGAGRGSARAPGARTLARAHALSRTPSTLSSALRSSLPRFLPRLPSAPARSPAAPTELLLRVPAEPRARPRTPQPRLCPGPPATSSSAAGTHQGWPRQGGHRRRRYPGKGTMGALSPQPARANFTFNLRLI